MHTQWDSNQRRVMSRLKSQVVDLKLLRERHDVVLTSKSDCFTDAPPLLILYKSTTCTGTLIQRSKQLVHSDIAYKKAYFVIQKRELSPCVTLSPLQQGVYSRMSSSQQRDICCGFIYNRGFIKFSKKKKKKKPSRLWMKNISIHKRIHTWVEDKIKPSRTRVLIQLQGP